MVRDYLLLLLLTDLCREEVTAMLSTQPLEVRVTWDDEARVWIATSEDIPGLCAEASTLEELIDVVSGLAPELLELNGVTLSAPTVPVHITAERTATVP